MRLNSKTFLEAFLSLLIFFCPFSYALAAEEYFAEPLVGHTTYYDGSTVRYYDGMGGNEVIFNHNPSTGLGFAESGYNPSFATTRYKQPAAANTIDACAVEIAEAPFSLTDVTRCFFLNLNSYKNFLMISRTSRNNIPGVEIAALIFDDVITGDVYNTGLNFALYGRNLKAKSAAMNGATWDTGSSYTINPQAQASYTASNKDAFDRHIADLQGEAKVTTNATTVSTWNLQSNTSINTANNLWSKTRPEGGVWYIDSGSDTGTVNLDLSGNAKYQYSDVGTIIVHGNLNIKSSIVRNSAATGDKALGIIVVGSGGGNVTISSGITVEAAIFCQGVMNFSNNIDLNGSFMAQNFNAPANAQGVHIVYNAELENLWPPGFRYFNMPHAESATP